MKLNELNDLINLNEDYRKANTIKKWIDESKKNKISFMTVSLGLFLESDDHMSLVNPLPLGHVIDVDGESAVKIFNILYETYTKKTDNLKRSIENLGVEI